MNTINKKPTNIKEVTAYFLACGYFYREIKNNIETSIDKNHSIYTVASFNTETLEGIGNKSFEKLADAKKEFKRLANA